VSTQNETSLQSTASHFVGADASTAQFLQQMMPLCDHHAFVEMFVEQQSRHEYGASLSHIGFNGHQWSRLCELLTGSQSDLEYLHKHVNH